MIEVIHALAYLLERPKEVVTTKYRAVPSHVMIKAHRESTSYRWEHLVYFLILIPSASTKSVPPEWLSVGPDRSYCNTCHHRF